MKGLWCLLLLVPLMGAMDTSALRTVLGKYGYAGCVPVVAEDQLWVVETFVGLEMSRLSFLCGWPVALPLDLRDCLRELRVIVGKEEK